MDSINDKIKKILRTGLWKKMHHFFWGTELNINTNDKINKINSGIGMRYIRYIYDKVSKEKKSFEEAKEDAKNHDVFSYFNFDGFFDDEINENVKESIEEFAVNYICIHIHPKYKNEDLVKILEGLKNCTSFDSLIEKINHPNQIVLAYLNKDLFKKAYDYFKKHKILNRKFYDQFLNITENPKFKEIEDILKWIREILQKHINLIYDEMESEKDENKHDELSESFGYFHKVRSSFIFYVFDVENLKKLQQSNNVIEDIKSFYESNSNGKKAFNVLIFPSK